ncbi:cupin domain-containing protein [Pseudoxanthomonas putridarboris]|uniref:Cupin domain-containing protein n=1 Tax=Pseudoxanthomonas putridarboris TaxID=752605 RepID=A0ABU9J459_9GAMM
MLYAVPRRKDAGGSGSSEASVGSLRAAGIDRIDGHAPAAPVRARPDSASGHASAAPRCPPQHAWIKYDRDSFWFDVGPGERMTLRAPGQGTGTAVTLCESRISPGSSCPPHVHHTADEKLHVLAGTLVVQCGKERFEAPEGTTVVIPRGLPHAWSNTSPREVRVLAYFTPGGIEDYFVKVARIKPQERELVARQHDSRLLHPID